MRKSYHIFPGNRNGNHVSQGFKAGGGSASPPFCNPVLKQVRVSPPKVELFINHWEQPVKVDHNTFEFLHRSLAPMINIIKPLLVVVLLLGSSCRKCYDCQATDTQTGVVYDHEHLCGDDEREDYLDTFHEPGAFSTAKCTPA